MALHPKTSDWICFTEELAIVTSMFSTPAPSLVARRPFCWGAGINKMIESPNGVGELELQERSLNG